ncbi:K+/H+ antiporter subunit F [Cypionkella sp.]|jgi:multicomponent K+:H+ antiporter subunit F|uniref:K+/H+ antiporter subunit F n=1 Tax=Cypionkella sp. TaxID=2811411 RepID=UPI003752D22D
MLDYALTFAISCFALALLLNLWRLATAPTIPDRILAVDTMVVNVIALIVLYSVMTGRELNFEAAMLFSMTGFVSTVAFCKYLLRRSIIE